MRREKLVSVIMPVYNSEKYLEEAIESILKQTYSNFELIIINDGSTDNSLNIINTYASKDKRIIYLSRENKGLVHSLNEGIKLSSGEYIARMDADDISYSKRFEKQVELLSRNPNLYLVGTDFEVFFEKGVSEDLKKEMQLLCENSRQPIDAANRLTCLLEGYKVLHATWMVKRSLFEKIGGYKNYASEDSEFLFRTTIQGYDIDKVDEVLYRYRIYETSKGAVERKNNLYKKDNLIFKLEYLENEIGENIKKIKYIIWGADISGNLAYKTIMKQYPEAELKAYIDSKKKGSMNGVPIIRAEEINNIAFDYIFICTRSGAKYAMEFLSQRGYHNIESFFKIV